MYSVSLPQCKNKVTSLAVFFVESTKKQRIPITKLYASSFSFEPDVLCGRKYLATTLKIQVFSAPLPQVKIKQLARQVPVEIFVKELVILTFTGLNCGTVVGHRFVHIVYQKNVMFGLNVA